MDMVGGAAFSLVLVLPLEALEPSQDIGDVVSVDSLLVTAVDLQ